MRTVACQLLANQPIKHTFESELTARELPAFSMEQRRNIYLVFKEALHNIVKHAQDTNANVRIIRKTDELCIRIEDNGQGFDPKQVGEGNGLANFQKRAAEGRFAISVCSEVGQGTTVEMRIPVPATITIGE